MADLIEKFMTFEMCYVLGERVYVDFVDLLEGSSLLVDLVNEGVIPIGVKVTNEPVRGVAEYYRLAYVKKEYPGNKLEIDGSRHKLSFPRGKGRLREIMETQKFEAIRRYEEEALS